MKKADINTTVNLTEEQKKHLMKEIEISQNQWNSVIVIENMRYLKGFEKL